MPTLTPSVNLEVRMNHACQGDGGRELKYPGRTYTGRTCKLHTERPQLGFKPGTLLLRGDCHIATDL